MHTFRRRWEDLSPEAQQGLEELFEKVPTLGAIYHFRWQATRIFDTAMSPEQAEEDLKAWIKEVRQTELDWEPFIGMLHNHWDGILAYFQERKSSGPVEGLNTKVRVVLRRGYGIPTLTTLWQRLLLDVNWAWKKLGQTIRNLRALVCRIQGQFARCYT